ncbi:MAG: cytochrome C biosynthesis protein [Planctomycetota bacterium]
MKKRALYWIVPVSLLTVLPAIAFLMWRSAAVDFAGAIAVNRPPQIRPDYRDAVVPPNIAPLNFLVEEPGTRYGVRVRSAEGGMIELVSRTPQIAIPPSRWKRLLAANRGRKLYFDVCVRREDGQWTRFEPIQNTIADAEIDRYLFYRLIKPIYILRVNVGIYQRDIETYEESVVLSNRSFKGGCINCHTFAPNHPDQMILQCRGSSDAREWSGMIVVREGKVRKVDTRTLIGAAEHDRGRVGQSMAAFTAWHPNGRLVAFSANKITQFFHAAGENRDVFDAQSDLALYDADSNTVTTTPDISQPDRLETFPTWSPDGRYLYFSSTRPLPKERYREVRYDLMRIAYEADSGRWGEVEPVLLAKETGLSITEPRVSPDGRWLLFCMSSYGAFPVFQPSSDLYLLDLKTRQYHPLAVNSERCESWHSWSSNSRWIAFASKRRDGVFSRVYFSHVDPAGHAHKPVLLPQKDPTFYDRFLKTYNVPELASAPAPATCRALARAVRSPGPPGVAAPDPAPGMHEPEASGSMEHPP